MDPVPYTWRAGTGYTPAPNPNPNPNPEIQIQLQPPTIIPMTCYNHSYYFCTPAQVALAAPAAPASTTSKKSSTSSKKSEAPKPQPPPAPASESHKSANAPPKLRLGGNYMFPPEHTKLHIFNKSSKIWEEKYKGKSFDFKQFTVATTFTPSMVIENVLGKTGDDAKGWAITEVVEIGDGEWKKGTTIEYGGDKSGGSLASMGWSGKRGNSLPPVWAVVHRV